jgi:zinc protease
VRTAFAAIVSALELLASIMTIRELDEVREKQGASYSASANSAMSRYFPGFGFIITRASVRPDIDDTYYRTVSAIVADLKQRPVTADELARVRVPMIDRLHNDLNSNGYWLARLSGTIRDPRQIVAIGLRERSLASISPEDIRQAATTYLDMAKALRIQIKPGAAAKSRSSFAVRLCREEVPMVGPPGLEPGTSRLKVACSTN